MLLCELLQQGRPLFVSRPLVNVTDVVQWAARQGFISTLADEMHVTLAFSKQPVNWLQFKPRKNRLIVDSEYAVKRLGDKGAAVLSFSSAALQQRWQEFCDGGASWDFPTYQPHMTISYASGHLDPATIEPYSGSLIFGPEKFAIANEDWADEIREEPVDKAAPTA